MGVLVTLLHRRLQEDMVLSSTQTSLDYVFPPKNFVFALKSSKKRRLLFPPLRLHVLANFLDKFENPNVKNKTAQSKTPRSFRSAFKELGFAVSSILGGDLYFRMGVVRFFPSTEN